MRKSLLLAALNIALLNAQSSEQLSDSLSPAIQSPKPLTPFDPVALSSVYDYCLTDCSILNTNTYTYCCASINCAITGEFQACIPNTGVSYPGCKISCEARAAVEYAVALVGLLVLTNLY